VYGDEPDRQTSRLAPWRGEDPAVLERGTAGGGVSAPTLAAGTSSRDAAVAPMSVVSVRCHELRIVDAAVTWRIVYRIDPDAIVIGDVFSKKTAATPRSVIEVCKRRFREYDDA